MRVALASLHPRSLSGQIEGLVGLAQALERRGHKVRLVSAFPTRDLLASSRLGLTDGRPLLSFAQPFRLLRILSDLVRLASQVDVIHLNLPTPAFSMVADLLQKFVCTPVVVGYEAHLVNVPDLLRLDRLRQAPEFYLPRLLVNNRLVARVARHSASRYVVSSRYQRSELVSLGVDPARIRLIPNVLPVDKLRRAPRGANRDGLPAGRLLTYVGHYNHVKGVDVLVDAFRQLAPCYPDLNLVLAWSGLGAKQDTFGEGASGELEGRIHQVGRVRVPELFGASDAVVLPYRLTIGQAAYPATLLEAIAANVPVVTADLPLLRELTQGGKTALLAAPDDSRALATAVERVLNDAPLVTNMLEAQRRWLPRLDPQRAVHDYETLYKQVTVGEEGVRQVAEGCGSAR